MLLCMLHDCLGELNEMIADEAHLIFHALDQTINQKWLAINSIAIVFCLLSLEIAMEENDL